MWRPSSRAVHVGVARGSRISSSPRPPGAETAFAPVARFMPPAALVPRVSGQREQPARGRHRRKIQRHAGAMQIHRGFQQRLVLPLAAHRRQHRHLGAAPGETFLNGMNQRGMRADFQPHVHAEFRQRIDRRRKLHGLPHASSPVGGAARFARATPAGDGAEKRDRLGLRHEIGQVLSRVPRRPAASADDGRDDRPGRVGRKRLAAPARRAIASSEIRAPGERQRTRAVERGDRDRAVVARDQRTRFLFAQTDGEHRSFAARAAIHEPRPQHDDPRALLPD